MAAAGAASDAENTDTIRRMLRMAFMVLGSRAKILALLSRKVVC
jgi:hypothetical protein